MKSRKGAPAGAPLRLLHHYPPELLKMIEAEVLNQISAHMDDLATRTEDIRGYL
jgi:hypothetical protein